MQKAFAVILGGVFFLVALPFVYLYDFLGAKLFWLLMLCIGGIGAAIVRRRKAARHASNAATTNKGMEALDKPVGPLLKSPLRKKREAAVFNAKNHRLASEIRAREAARKIAKQYELYFEQHKAYVSAIRTVKLPRVRNEPEPSRSELLDYFNLLDSLQVNLLQKSDQLNCFRLQYHAAQALNDSLRTAKVLGSATAVAEVPAAELPYSNSSFSSTQEKEIERDLSWVYMAYAELLLRSGKTRQAKTTLDHGADVLRAFGFEVDVDDWYEVLGILDREAEAEANRLQIIEFIRQRPGLLQADFLKNHNLATSEMLYWMAQRGEIIRIKSGRTYSLSVPAESTT